MSEKRRQTPFSRLRRFSQDRLFAKLASVHQTLISLLAVGHRVETSPQISASLAPIPGGVYSVRGDAPAVGPYNSHFVFVAFLSACGLFGWVSPWLVAWVAVCFCGGLMFDQRRLGRKLALTALPRQTLLYCQLLLQAIKDVAILFAHAFTIYIFSAPILQRLDLSINSFVLLYTIVIVIRSWTLVRYLTLLNDTERPIEQVIGVAKANLAERTSARRHVCWAYCLGNVGLVVRCAVQVVTLSGLESLRIGLGLDLSEHAMYSDHLILVALGCAVAWLVVLPWNYNRTELVYYRAHRTFHEVRPLYHCIHAIHHRGVYPTPLDSGTISPAEFGITEFAAPLLTIIPNWAWVLAQLGIAYGGHWPAHDSGTKSTAARHHLLHHHLFHFNFGLTPRLDRVYQTERTDPA